MKTHSATVSMLNCRYSSSPSTAGFVDYIEGAIRSVAERDAVVRVTILQAAPEADLEAPKIEGEEG